MKPGCLQGSPDADCILLEEEKRSNVTPCAARACTAACMSGTFQPMAVKVCEARSSTFWSQMVMSPAFNNSAKGSVLKKC